MALKPQTLSLNNTFSNKKVLITGNTGFKGSWLTLWLKELNAKVYGFSNNLNTNPSMFVDLKIENGINQTYGNIFNKESILETINYVQPDFIFHLAAQSIVSESYKNPLETIKTNALGTATLLDAILDLEFKGVVVMVTSDKCYQNDERNYGYIETDRLGGRDPYSASKAGAEIFLSSYLQSFLYDNSKYKIGIARAGNVIGGGDWNANRIIVDCVKAWASGNKVSIRNPKSTRPWQHVLEPLSGYLKLAQALSINPKIHGEAFNFGPNDSNIYTVVDVVNRLGKNWGHKIISNHINFINEKNMHEASLLSLNCGKAERELSWTPRLHIDECIKLVADWYLQYNKNSKKLFELTIQQIKYYESDIS